ncbi:unnamed protein product, partial [Mesorhabditis spiculigera]
MQVLASSKAMLEINNIAKDKPSLKTLLLFKDKALIAARMIFGGELLLWKAYVWTVYYHNRPGFQPLSEMEYRLMLHRIVSIPQMMLIIEEDPELHDILPLPPLPPNSNDHARKQCEEWIRRATIETKENLHDL